MHILWEKDLFFLQCTHRFIYFPFITNMYGSHLNLTTSAIITTENTGRSPVQTHRIIDKAQAVFPSISLNIHPLAIILFLPCYLTKVTEVLLWVYAVCSSCYIQLHGIVHKLHDFQKCSSLTNTFIYASISQLLILAKILPLVPQMH